MHPALSVIFFTTLSGAGYGLLVWLGLFGSLGGLLPERWFGFTGFAIALLLITLGLISSTLHLGRPERAWRALSQWRSSWLSREGVMSLLTYAPAGLYAIGWVVLGAASGGWAVPGLLMVVAALVTIYCTAMIYASLPTVPRWTGPLVPANYLAMGLMLGAIWLDALALAFSQWHMMIGLLAPLAVVVAMLAKIAYWRRADSRAPTATAESATGLGAFGEVRILETPSTEETYIGREMGYRVGRKHAARLRILALVLGFVVPLALCLLALVLGWSGAWAAGAVAAAAAVISASVGVFVERWLFFAEAKHVVQLYYGAQAV